MTLLYGALFLFSGAVLLAIASGVARVGSTQAVPAPDQNRAANQNGAGSQTALARADARVRQLQDQLAAAQHNQGSSVTHQLLIGSLVALAIMAGASALLGWLMAGHALRPLRTITATARRISEDNLHERLAFSGPDDELKRLADTIDDLLERLESAFAAQRRFVANASHELRTPLATMRASLDVAMAKPDPIPPQTAALAGRLRAELDRVDDLLEGFLALARAQHGALPDAAVISVADLTAGSLAARAGAISARGLLLSCGASTGSVPVAGSSALLSRMVANVIDNAIVHNEPGGWITVTAAAAGGTARLVVENGGARAGRRAGSPAGAAIPPGRPGADRLGRRLRARAVDRRRDRRRSRRRAGPAAPPGRRPAGGHHAAARAAGAAAAGPGRIGPDRGDGMRVLVVEDSRSLADVLVEGLRDQGMAVDAAHDGLEAAAKLGLNGYDVVVLDRDLPGIHGDALCQMITDSGDRVMVLMLTASAPLATGSAGWPSAPMTTWPSLSTSPSWCCGFRPSPGATRPSAAGSCGRPESSWTRCAGR